MRERRVAAIPILVHRNDALPLSFLPPLSKSPPLQVCLSTALLSVFTARPLCLCGSFLNLLSGSHLQMRPHTLEDLRADAFHAQQIIGRIERAALLSVLDDAVGERAADAVELSEFDPGGAVDVDAVLILALRQSFDLDGANAPAAEPTPEKNEEYDNRSEANADEELIGSPQPQVRLIRGRIGLCGWWFQL